MDSKNHTELNPEKRNFLALGGILGAGLLSACAPASETGSLNVPDGTLDEESIDLAIKNSSVFLIEKKEIEKRQDFLDYYWSPTCIFSSHTFAKRIIPLAKNKEFSEKNLIRVHMHAREEIDLAYYTAMRRYDDFGPLASTFLRLGSRDDQILPIDRVDEIAKKMGISKRMNFEPNKEILSAATYYAANKFGVRYTPTVQLNFEEIRFA